MISAEKLSLVTKYLEANFPDLTVMDFFNSDLMVHVFYFEGESKQVSIRRAFFEDKSVPDIEVILEKSGIADFLRNVEPASIVVDEKGNITVSRQ
jgi:hypothetical protein